jgi:hypothetical protein
MSLFDFGIPENILILEVNEIIPTENQVKMKNADFLFLTLASPSLLTFYTECHQENSDIIDSDLRDYDFVNSTNFEIFLRMSTNNIPPT